MAARIYLPHFRLATAPELIRAWLGTAGLGGARPGTARPGSVWLGAAWLGRGDGAVTP